MSSGQAVLRAIAVANQPVTIGELAAATDLARQTVSNAVSKLETEGRVQVSALGNMKQVTLPPVEKALNFAELFCGPGGMGYGLMQAGFAPAWAIDIDKDTCATYARNVGAHAEPMPIENADFDTFEHVRGLAFGFPCNDFSMVGEKRGTSGYYGSLYEHSVRALDNLAPDWFIAENVPGLISLNGFSILQKFANAGPGYRVSVHKFEMEQYGVPQRRTRIIAVGIRDALGLEFKPPAPTHREPITAQEALEDVEDVEFNNESPVHKQRTKDLIEAIPPGGNAWHDDVPEHLRLNVEKVRMSMIYRRLLPDEPSFTVTGSGGGGTHMYHWDEPRALTNRERARLQSFPDDFVFVGKKESVRRQVGMAVPPEGARVIGGALLKTLKREPYASVKTSEAILRPNTDGRHNSQTSGELAEIKA